MNFEKKLTRLEEIVEKMEGGEMPLEDSLKFFEEGVKLSRDCHQELSTAEQKVQTLVGVDADGKPKMENFPEGDS